MGEASKLPLEAMERTQYPVDPRKLASHPDVEGGIQSLYLQKVFIPFWSYIYYEDVC